jgi:hypothetical protein
MPVEKNMPILNLAENEKTARLHARLITRRPAAG